VTTHAAPRPNVKLGPLMLRMLTGGLLLLAVVGLILLGLWGIYIIVAALMGLALWEFRRLSDLMGFRAPSWLLFPLAAYLALSGTLLQAIPLQVVLGLALIVGLTVFLFLPGRREGLGRWAMGMAGAIYLGLPMNYYLLLYTHAGPGRGLTWLLLTIVTVVASDTAAMLVGQRLGRHPFFAAISPRKTVEGALGGILLSVPVTLLGGILFLGLKPWQAVSLGLLIGVTAELGDLVESQMKRLAGVKDSSHLIPGHGGVLDRLDSLLFPPIVVYLFAYYLHLL
jgi:phosphatidate cytidylyltransferase